MVTMTTVLIAVAEPLVRIGLRIVLDGAPDFTVAGEVGDVAGISDLTASAQPDILVLDSQFQQRSETLMSEISQASPSCRVIVMVDHSDESCTLRSLLTESREHRPADEALRIMQECCLLALRESAHGCLPKSSSPEALLTALRAVAAGEIWAGPGLAQHWLDWWKEPASGEQSDSRLTKREIEIIGLVTDGLSNAEIARDLGLKEQTVKNHVARVMSKLGVRNRVQLALRAVRDHIA